MSCVVVRSSILLVPLAFFAAALLPLFSGQFRESTHGSRQRFSHRRHLALAGMGCENCHYSAHLSRKAEDNLLPKAETCLSCHDGLHAMKHGADDSAYAFKNPPRTLRFNHQQHLALGNVAPALAAAVDGGTYLGTVGKIRTQLETDNACAACHRGLYQSDLTSPANSPSMADCLVCHSKIDPPFSCELCHTKEAHIKPASHTPDYIDAHSSRNAKLDKPSCKICHSVGFRCMGCHG
jgi:hypothetical protein